MITKVKFLDGFYAHARHFTSFDADTQWDLGNLQWEVGGNGEKDLWWYISDKCEKYIQKHNGHY